LKLLAFDRSKVSPDLGAIGVALRADFLQNCCDFVGGCAKGFGNSHANELKTFGVASRI
jgi:hypothetical protein